jgi:hypothetical protein
MTNVAPACSYTGRGDKGDGYTSKNDLTHDYFSRNAQHSTGEAWHLASTEDSKFCRISFRMSAWRIVSSKISFSTDVSHFFCPPRAPRKYLGSVGSIHDMPSRPERLPNFQEVARQSRLKEYFVPSPYVVVITSRSLLPTVQRSKYSNTIGRSAHGLPGNPDRVEESSSR